MNDYLRQLATAQVWKENTRAMLAEDGDAVTDTAMVLISRTDFSPEACRRSAIACEVRAEAARQSGQYQEAAAAG